MLLSFLHGAALPSIMKHACSNCGKIHDKRGCPSRQPDKKNTALDKFRSTSGWKNKREEIKERDHFLCQICIRNLYNTLNQYTYDDLSVHHVIPLAEDYDKRLDNDYLLTICDYHHEMAESGEISREVLFGIIREQEASPGGV